MKDIKLIELFSGIGAQAKAFERIDCFNTEVVGTCDLDKEVVVDYAAVHCGLTNEVVEDYDFYPSKEEMVKDLTDKRLGYDFVKDKSYDWAKLAKKKDKTKGIEKYWLADQLSKNLGDITQVKSLPETDVLFYSSPCFVKGTLVLTDNGYKPIEEIEVGDKVLTHTNKYQSVVKTMINKTNTLVKIKSTPLDSLYCTPNHPFYVRKRKYVWHNDIRRYVKEFDEPTWIEAKDLTRDCFVGVAINQESKLPEWNGIDIKWKSRDRVDHKNVLNEMFNKDDFWYMIGRFIGDGWVRDDHGIVICGDQKKMDSLVPVVERLGLNYCIVRERTNIKLQISIKELEMYCSQFGRGASNKHLTSDILNLPIDKLRSFIKGYLESDGCFTNNMHKIASVSKKLIYDTAQCIAKAYNVPFGVHLSKRKPTCVIEGRTVNQRDGYNLTFQINENGVIHKKEGFYEDGYIWLPVRSVETIEEQCDVYNMEVENDNSYVVQNVIVHNCTDYSLAGKQEGSKWTCLDCGTEYNPTEFDVKDRYTCPHCGSHNIKSTRSGLLFEVERLLVDYEKRECLPKFLMLENVAALVNSKFIGDFTNWLERLEIIGYNNYWKVMNTKDTGIPQNRPRLFCVSIRKDIDTGKFTFPEPFDSGLRLKDLLEDDQDVIDKYFLSDEVQARLVITNPEFSDNIIGTTKPEFRTIGQRDVVYKEDCIMGTLMATDYKQPKQIYVGELTENKPIQTGTMMGKYEKMMDVSRRVYDENGIAPTLHTCSGGNTEPKVGRDGLKVVRKLTPKECFRLQNFDDSDFEKCKAVGMSDTQGYKATGNSITVRCIELLAQHLYKAQYDSSYVCLDEYMKNIRCTEMPKLVGGFGEMKSNGGKQFYQQDRVYDGNGIAMAHPAQIPGGSYKYLVDASDNADNKIVTVGQVSSEGSQGGKVYGIDGVSQTVMACTHGYGMGNIYDNRKVYCAASRGRYDEDGNIDQHLEVRGSDFTNALTTVPKDNYIVEIAE